MSKTKVVIIAPSPTVHGPVNDVDFDHGMARTSLTDAEIAYWQGLQYQVFDAEDPTVNEDNLDESLRANKTAGSLLPEGASRVGVLAPEIDANLSGSSTQETPAGSAPKVANEAKAGK